MGAPERAVAASGFLSQLREREIETALVPARSVAMNATRLHGLVDRGNETMGGRRRSFLVSALQGVTNALELILYSSEAAAVDKGAALILARAFGCGFGIGHDVGFLRKRTARIAAPQSVSSITKRFVATSRPSSLL